MKVLSHSYGEFSYFLKEAIKISYEKKLPIEWSVIFYSTTEDLLKDFEDLIGKENILYLQEKLNDYMKNPVVDLNKLKDFPSSLFNCISTSKVVSGEIPLQSKNRSYQLRLIINTYIAYKEFLLQNKPDFIFFFLVEHYDAMILYHLCNELGIKPIIYDHARNLKGSFFVESIYEELPSYTYNENPSQEIIEKAKNFIYSFRNNFISSFEVEYTPKLDEIIKTPFRERNIFKKCFRIVKKRITNLFFTRKNVIKERHLVNKYTFFQKLKILFYPLTTTYRRLKGKVHKKFYDLHKIEQLPEKFIYYPLQYTPETSINTPAPYFIDQLRSIDLILSAMPANFYLVVKEHPAMQGIRPISFYKELRKKANVLLADFSLPSIEVIKKASLTISVTGTACLEAFLVGKPSLHIGRSFFTDWIYKFDSFLNFKEVVREALEIKNIPEEKIIDFVSRIFNISSDFIIFSPGDPGRNPDLVMNKTNIEKFLEGLLKHIMLLKKWV